MINNAIVSLFLLFIAVGINSSTTTYIIAPDAKESKYGNINLTFNAIMQPIRPDIISIKPDNDPNKNAFNLELFSHLIGSDTAQPSGKFWIPIPKVNNIALINVALSIFNIVDAKATPTTIPSGILCKVIDKNNILLLLLFTNRYLSNNIFNKYKNSAPIKNPINKTNQVFNFKLLDKLIAGLSREKNEAAIIMPDDILSIISSNLLLIFLKKNTKDDPSVVNKKVKDVAINVK